MLESLDWARIDVGVLGVESYSENDAQIEAMLRSHGLDRRAVDVMWEDESGSRRLWGDVLRPWRKDPDCQEF